MSSTASGAPLHGEWQTVVAPKGALKFPRFFNAASVVVPRAGPSADTDPESKNGGDDAATEQNFDLVVLGGASDLPDEDVHLSQIGRFDFSTKTWQRWNGISTTATSSDGGDVIVRPAVKV